MKTTIKILALLMLITTTTSCFMDGVKGNRNVVSEQRNVSDFDAIDAAAGIDVILTLNKDISVRVEADENLQDIIITEVKDGTLLVYAKKNIWSSKSQKVYVSVPSIHEITASSGAEITSKDVITEDELKVRASSGSNIKLNVHVNRLSCKTSSGADVNLKGEASNLIADASSGSGIRASDLISETCNSTASSGADIYVNVVGNLETNSSSGGNINYEGNPKRVKKVSVD